MATKIGIIQLRGAGDCLIAVPIAKWLYNKGMDIYWVIDGAFEKAFSQAFPYIKFMPLTVEEKTIQSNIRNPYWFETPHKMLAEKGMDEIISFPYEEILHYKKIGIEARFIDPIPIRARELKLPFHTTFDQFKYAACNVPFDQKWKLDIRRNIKREEKLFDQVVEDKGRPYVVTHLVGAMGRIQFNLDTSSFLQNIGMANYQVISISPEFTDNIFDWITVLERASCFIGLDSFFVNLVEQMNMRMPKFFIRRSPTNFTPVLRNNWEYIPVSLATDDPHDLKF